MATTSRDVGNETAATIIHELILRGFSVSLPFGDNDGYDLIVDDAGRRYRVQCKTVWQSTDSTIRFNAHSPTTKDGAYHERSYEGEVEAFLIRDPATEQLYWVASEDAATRKMTPRPTAAIDHPAINWAADFESTGEIPRGGVG